MLKLYNLKSLWLILFVLWTVLLTFVTVYPDSDKIIISSESGFRWDYLEHFIAYGIFGGLYILWRSRSDFTLKGIEMALLFAFTCIFSILTEYMQVMIPGRAFNVTDMVFNATTYVFQRRLKTKDGRSVTPDYWNQLTEKTIPQYWNLSIKED